MMEFDEELDAIGLKCPLPILRCKKALANIQAGKTLKIIATDPSAVKDFAAFCKQTGHQLVFHEQIDTNFNFYIKKRSN